MTVTQKSPKQYRYTFTTRLQNLSLDVIEKLYRANMVYVQPGKDRDVARRKEFQSSAMADLDLLDYFSYLAMEQKCILPKQYEQIAKQITECKGYLGAWINSDKKRLQPQQRL